LQEAITLMVFCGFSWLVLKKPLARNHYVGFGFVMIGVFVVFHFDRGAKAVEPMMADVTPLATPAQAVTE
jgi:drug/metabolite transporter (DMT)-like permease